jgi:hypothetical protein
MLRLPDEVLLRIFECLYYVGDDFDVYGEKDDLLACRAACRRFANVRQGLAFRHTNFFQDEESYKRLLEMSKSPYVCERVQRLTCYFADLEAGRTPEKFAESRGIDRKYWTQEEFNDAYEEYCRSCQYQELLEDGNVDIATLAAALPLFRRLRSIQILRDLSDLEEDWSDLDGSSTYSQAGQRFFEAITSALSVSELGIEELLLGSFDFDSPSLIGIIQSLAPGRLRLYQQAFGTLKRVQMLLPWIVYDEDIGREDQDLNCAGISALIRSAPLVEELRLEFDRYGAKPLPPNFLGSLKLPSLRALALESAVFEDSLCLIKFLSKHAISLKEVDFGTLTLQTGSWETVFIGMRDALTLHSISMVGEFRVDEWTEITPEWREHGRQVLNDRAIENFIRRRTNDNPFDLLRLARVLFPPHESYRDTRLCVTEKCPYQSCLTTEERIS